MACCRVEAVFYLQMKDLNKRECPILGAISAAENNFAENVLARVKNGNPRKKQNIRGLKSMGAEYLLPVIFECLNLR